MNTELLKTIDPTKSRPIVFNFPEMTGTEFDRYRMQGIPDEEICKIAQLKKKVA